jgi:hypothetical protein
MTTNPGTPMAMQDVHATLAYYRRRLQVHPWSETYKRRVRDLEKCLRFAARRDKAGACLSGLDPI